MKIYPMDSFSHQFLEVWQSTLGLAEFYLLSWKRFVILADGSSTDNKQTLITSCCAKIITMTGKFAVFSEYKCIITKFECLKKLLNPPLNFGQSWGKEKKINTDLFLRWRDNQKEVDFQKDEIQVLL